MTGFVIAHFIRRQRRVSYDTNRFFDGFSRHHFVCRFLFLRVYGAINSENACKTLRFCNSYENAAFYLCNMSANPFENGLILMKISEMR